MERLRAFHCSIFTGGFYSSSALRMASFTTRYAKPRRMRAAVTRAELYLNKW